MFSFFHSFFLFSHFSLRWRWFRNNLINNSVVHNLSSDVISNSRKNSSKLLNEKVKLTKSIPFLPYKVSANDLEIWFQQVGAVFSLNQIIDDDIKLACVQANLNTNILTQVRDFFFLTPSQTLINMLRLKRGLFVNSPNFRNYCGTLSSGIGAPRNCSEKCDSSRGVKSPTTFFEVYTSIVCLTKFGFFSPAIPNILYGQPFRQSWDFFATSHGKHHYETLQCISEAASSFCELKHHSQKHFYVPSTLEKRGFSSRWWSASILHSRVLKRYYDKVVILDNVPSVSIDRLESATLQWRSQPSVRGGFWA